MRLFWRLFVAEFLLETLWYWVKLLDYASRRENLQFWWAWVVYEAMSPYPPGELNHDEHMPEWLRTVQGGRDREDNLVERGGTTKY